MGTVADKLALLARTKAGIKAAIEEKGQTVGDEAPFSAYPEAIRAIETAPRLNEARNVEVIAGDQIRIGDTVYTVEQGVEDIRGDPHMPALSGSVLTAAVSPWHISGIHLLVLGGTFEGKAKAYADWGFSSYVGDIPADGNGGALTGNVNAAAFSADGKLLVLGGVFAGHAKLYSVDRTTITYIGDIPADAEGNALNELVSAAAFSPNGKLLVLGGSFTGGAKAYSVEGTAVTYIGDINADAEGTALNSSVSAISFYWNHLVLGGNFAGYAKAYSVEGTAVTYISDIYADGEGTALNGRVYAADFYSYLVSGDSYGLVLGGQFSGYAKVYSVTGNTVSYVGDIPADSEGTALNGMVFTVAANPTSSNDLLLGGNFKGYAKLYSLDRSTVSYVSDVPADKDGSALSNGARAAVFASVDNVLVLGGLFTGYAKRYIYASDDTWKYVDDLYAGGQLVMTLGGVVRSAAFSPDGKLMVLCGAPEVGARVYAVENDRLTYIRNIYEENDLTETISLASFSPDGKTLLLAGGGGSSVKIYSVNETEFTYAGDLPGKTEGSVLTGVVNTLLFSPNGRLLIVGGASASIGRCGAYTVDGTTIQFLSQIYADDGTTALNNIVTCALFSPDGKTLVLGGSFSKFAKVYSVDGETVTYVGALPGAGSSANINGRIFAAAMSPDGRLLVICKYGNPARMLYAVNGTEITWISNIDGNNGQSAAVAFSPDGKLLVAGGTGSYGAMIYKVEGTTVTYIEKIRKDEDGPELVGAFNTIAFSPDGKSLVLGGTFTDHGKRYPVAGGAIQYKVMWGEPAANGQVPAGTAPCGVGYATEDMAAGETGTVTVIGEVTGE